MNIINAKASDLHELYDGSAFTIEGLSDDDDNLNALVKWLEEHGCKMRNDDIYIIKGKLMNEVYHLTGDNKYQDQLTIVSIKLSDLSNVNAVVMARFEIGARWFDDIVDNNARRENS